MATKALLYSADRISFEKTKDSRCKALVRQLLAIEIGKRIYQRLMVSTVQEISAGRIGSHRAYKGPAVYQHHIEPKLYKVNRRQMEELERWYASVSGDSL